MSNRNSSRSRPGSAGHDAKRKPSSRSSRGRHTTVGVWRGVAAAVAAVAAGVWLQTGGTKPGGGSLPRPPRTLTFNKDIAPIVFRRCANCHRPGQSAPFSLLTYQDVRKRAKQIAEVTQRRYMPPWLPESGHGEFAGERRLTGDQIGAIQQWTAEGAV